MCLLHVDGQIQSHIDMHLGSIRYVFQQGYKSFRIHFTLLNLTTEFILLL